MIKKILTILIFLLIATNTVFAINIPSNLEDIDTDQLMETTKQEVSNTLGEQFNEEALPVWNDMWNWFELNILPDLINCFNSLMTPEREAEFEKEKQEVKEDFPGFITSITNTIKTIFDN